MLDFFRGTYILVGMLAGRPKLKRNADRTRELLLRAASGEIYKSGFRGTDVQKILDAAGVTKGAMYHHFQNKEALGYAVVEETLVRINDGKWVEPLQRTLRTGNPIDTLIEIVRATSLSEEHIIGGCPVNNLAQEMSPLDEGFRTRLAAVFGAWIKSIANALQAGQVRGLVRADVEPAGTATFLAATYEGYISLAKNAQDARVMKAGQVRMVEYLESLRPVRRKTNRTRG